MNAFREALDGIREDLWTAEYDPLPRLRSRRLARLPHVLVVLVAVAVLAAAVNQYETGYGLGNFGKWLAVIQSAALVAALVRPVPAWWATTMVMFVAAQAGEAHSAGNPIPPWVRLGGDGELPGFHGLPFDNGSPFPWTAAGIIVQALVLFLLALRVRPRIVAQALGINVLAGTFCLLFADRGHQSNAPLAISVFVVVAALGAALRSRRIARSELVVQEVLTAEERGRRTLLEERNRIARELHDVVAHHMSVISIQAQVAVHLVENPTDELKENLAGIRRSAVEALTELRVVLGVLRSEDDLSEGMQHAPQPTLDRLDELLATVRAAGLAVTTETTGEPRPLPPGTGLSAFRIVQEALSNAMRHAPGAAVRVEIGYLPHSLTVRVTNAAPERDVPSASPGTGHGLLGMRERTAMLGGELAAGATPEGGYEVTAILPVKPAAEPVEDTA
ncbi:sensor histidine kinase [Kitasatospora sp. MAP5-34]|uniref:sensor histidine kinase n=1 Tax=Kitasatospora sp. MAP5-34 TaxID=3035102 RepID=UPI00247319A2|nr:sensor histidine kinase [Kitasatospora sp. MAP5-34]